MAFVLDLGKAVRAQAVKVKVKGAEFTLFLRPPTLAQELSAIFSDTAFGDRAMSCVTGWDGVLDPSGNPVPFSHEALALLLRQHMEARTVFVDAVLAFYRGPNEEERGN